MIDDGAPHPVELLRDHRGIYGIGVSELFDVEAIAWSCGIETKSHAFEPPPRSLFLRPDWFPDAKPAPYAYCYGSRAVLQKITGGFRRGPFMHATEEHLRQFVHHAALNRATASGRAAASVVVSRQETAGAQPSHLSQ
jgi:hypothetical protein